jgi:hypothetical protein
MKPAVDGRVLISFAILLPNGALKMEFFAKHSAKKKYAGTWKAAEVLIVIELFSSLSNKHDVVKCQQQLESVVLLKRKKFHI